MVDIAKEVYRAFNAGDLATWLTFFAPNFEWHAADNSPIADHGPYYGLDTIQNEVFPRLARLFPGMKLRADEIFATENKAIMLGYYYDLPQKAGGKTEAQVAHILTFENGKIVKFQQYLDSLKFANL
ncbi:MAG: nuclear transport factor 2 family protein [Cyanobacteria bacterium J06636_16]